MALLLHQFLYHFDGAIGDASLTVGVYDYTGKLLGLNLVLYAIKSVIQGLVEVGFRALRDFLLPYLFLLLVSLLLLKFLQSVCEDKFRVLSKLDENQFALGMLILFQYVIDELDHRFFALLKSVTPSHRARVIDCQDNDSFICNLIHLILYLITAIHF